MTSPWDEPMEEIGGKQLSYIGMLLYFGLVMLATFGTLFLSIICLVLTSSIFEYRFTSDDTTNSDLNKSDEQAAVQYNLYIPQDSMVRFYLNSSGQLRQILARPQSENNMTQNGCRNLFETNGIVNSTNPTTLTDPIQDSMQIQSANNANTNYLQHHYQTTRLLGVETIPVGLPHQIQLPTANSNTDDLTENGTFSDTDDYD